MPVRGRVLAVRTILVAAMLLIAGVTSSGGYHLVGARSVSPADQAAALLMQARQRQMPEVRPGQVVRVTLRDYERPRPSAVDGPAHLDPAFLAPSVTLTEIWAVADDAGRASRVVTYVRDEAGGLIEVNAIDERAQLTAYSPRQNQTVTASFRERSPMTNIGERAANLTNPPPSQNARPLREQIVSGQPAIVLEYLTEADSTWLRLVATGEIKRPYAGDLEAREQGRRLIFDRDSSALLREEDFVVTAQGEEYLLRSRVWQQVEVFDASQVSVGTLYPVMPVPAERWQPVPLGQVALQQATTRLPFTLFAPGSLSVDNPAPAVTYGTGAQLAIEDVPLQFRGLDFAVQRGEAARLSYSATSRYLDLIQGPSASFAISLQAAPAFWSSARAITVEIEGATISGWLLMSAPGNTTADPSAGVVRRVPGVTWLLLPDAQGTGLLLMSQGFSEAELLEIAAGLQRVR